MTPQKFEEPMMVAEGSIVAQAATAGRYLLAAAGSFALGRGWIDGETLQFITTVVTIIAPLGYAMWKTFDNKRMLVRAAESASDSVAQVTYK